MRSDIFVIYLEKWKTAKLGFGTSSKELNGLIIKADPIFQDLN